MTSLLEPVLKKFNGNAGVVGSLVCTRDGMLIESSLSERFNDELISALVSSVCLVIDSVCLNLECSGFLNYRVSASSGDMIIVDLGRSIFVAILSNTAELSLINVALYQVTAELKKQASLG
ncbi:MAG: hypothetical protein IEMM0002_0915 [bacterium]|nr:MAG: hypothetical protein IEMM0002_0915 [bacterium]